MCMEIIAVCRNCSTEYRQGFRECGAFRTGDTCPEHSTGQYQVELTFTCSRADCGAGPRRTMPEHELQARIEALSNRNGGSIWNFRLDERLGSWLPKEVRNSSFKPDMKAWNDNLPSLARDGGKVSSVVSSGASNNTPEAFFAAHAELIRQWRTTGTMDADLHGEEVDTLEGTTTMGEFSDAIWESSKLWSNGNGESSCTPGTDGSRAAGGELVEKEKEREKQDLLPSIVVHGPEEIPPPGLEGLDVDETRRAGNLEALETLV